MWLFLWVYNFILLIFAIIILPKVLFERYYYGKHIKLFEKKMGSDFKDINKGSAPLVWIHAVSLGETKAIWKFANLLHNRYPSLQFLITSITNTGHKEARHSLPFAKYHLYLPFDFSWVIRPIVKKLQPDLVILSETDFWFNFLDAAKLAGAQVAVVNGKISARSLARYQWLGSLKEKYFSPVDLFCLQNTEYKERLEQLGIPSKKLIVTGNLKFDAPPERLTQEEVETLKKKLHTEDSIVIVAGSTHAEEEELILSAFKKNLLIHPKIKLILVPRHPERFQQVEKLLTLSAIPYAKWSSNPDVNAKIILMDTMGMLKKCYQISAIAIVAGSFIPSVGGHNIMEPAFYGVPVLFGPYMHTQTELVDLMLKAHAALQTCPQNLAQDIDFLLSNKEEYALFSKGGKALTESLQGTSECTLETIEKEFHLSRRLSIALK